MGSLLSSLFSFLFVGIARYISAKVLIVGAAIAAIVLLLSAMTIAFNQALSALSMVMPSEFQWGLSILPANLPVCLTSLIALRSYLFLVSVKFKIIGFKSQA